MKLVDIERLNSKQKLLFFATCLVLLIVISTVLMSFRLGYDVIDYKKENAYTFIFNSTEDNDRNTYWTLNSIILPFLESYQTVENMDISDLIEYKYDGYSLDDYYKALDTDYKKYLGKKKYLEVSKKMMEKMVSRNENGFVLKKEDLIKRIYKLNLYDNAYLCELNTVDKSSTAYIGIILDTEKSKYSIFYIE